MPGLDLYESDPSSMEGPCDYGNGPIGSIEVEELCNVLRVTEILKFSHLWFQFVLWPPFLQRGRFTGKRRNYLVSRTAN
jgi:hypothetical protein